MLEPPAPQKRSTVLSAKTCPCPNNHGTTHNTDPRFSARSDRADRMDLSTRSRHRSGLRSRWKSQNRMTVQPLRRSARWFRRSRFRFCSILVSQCSLNLCRQAGNRQPCQKAPSTKMAIRWSLRTKSGLPGRSRAWASATRPASASNLAIARSGPVSRPRIRDMTRDRVAASMMSPRWSRSRSMTERANSLYSPAGCTASRGHHRKRDCQSASNVDPGSAPNFDPAVAAASKRAIRSAVASERLRIDQARFLKRQLSLPVSTISQ